MEVAARFRVVRLTREELKTQCKRDDFEQWGAPALDLAQYQRKEQLQRQTAHSRRGSIFWALVQRADATGDESDEGDESDAGLEPGEHPIVCHCESHRFDCVLRLRSGETRRGFSHHIASVFTLPAFRKQGLATYFLTQVAVRMAELEDAVVSILYSDIGPTYYDRLGWRLYPSTMATLDLGDPKNADALAVEAASERTQEKLFLDDMLDEFLAADNERLVKQLSEEEYTGQDAFVVLPTRDSIQWQFCVGVHFANVRGYDEAPSQCGVRLPESDAFVIWCHNLKESTLYVVRARLGSNPEIAHLLLVAALQEAQKFKLSKVAVWNPPELLLSHDLLQDLRVTHAEREDSLSSAMVLCQPHVENVSTLPAVWLANEKYAWV